MKLSKESKSMILFLLGLYLLTALVRDIIWAIDEINDEEITDNAP